MQALPGSPPRPAGCATPRPSRHLFPYLPGQSGYNKRLAGAAGADPGVDPGLAVDTRVERRCLAGRLDPGRVRPIPSDRQAVRPGRLGRLRLLRQPFPVLLGAATAPDLTLPACPSRSPWPAPRPTNATSPSTWWSPSPTCSPPGRPDPHGRQGLPGAEFETCSRRTASRCSAPPRTEQPRPGAAAPPVPPDHRVGQPHPQRPTRPRTPRRTHQTPASPPAYSNDSSRSPPRSGTTNTRPTRPRSLIAYDH